MTTDSKSNETLCVPGGTRVPLGVSPAQSESLVGPQVNSGEDSEETSNLTRDLLRPSTCQSLPMLTAASLLESESTTISFTSSTSTQDSFGKRIRKNSQEEDDDQASSTAASMTLNSSPQDEMDEIEMKSPLKKNENLGVGSFELIQLKAVAHYGMQLNLSS